MRTESCSIPPSLIDEFGCLRKGDKTALVERLGFPTNSASAPDVVLVDASQLWYHVFWAVARTAGDLASSFGVRLSRYPTAAQTLVLFDPYYEDEPTAKDHERMRRAEAGSKDFHLTPNTQFPYREAMLNNSKNKSLLASILCGYSLQNNLQLVYKIDCLLDMAWRLTIRKNIHMEWGDMVLDIRATVDKLGCKCCQLLRMYTLSD